MLAAAERPAVMQRPDDREAESGQFPDAEHRPVDPMQMHEVRPLGANCSGDPGPQQVQRTRQAVPGASVQPQQQMLKPLHDPADTTNPRSRPDHAV